MVPPPNSAVRMGGLGGGRILPQGSFGTLPCRSIIAQREQGLRISILEDDPDQLALLKRWLVVGVVYAYVVAPTLWLDRSPLAS